jgi:hypothetical protein
MTNQNRAKTLAQWKEKARESLSAFTAKAARRIGVDIETPITRKDSPFLRKATLVMDPITVTLEDTYGGTFSCTYDISRTLSALRREFQKMEVSDSEIAAFAASENISLDEAMQRVAFRYVEAEMFATLGAGRFLHTELNSALKQTLSELLDLAFLRATREYGCEVVDPGPTLENHGRKHIQLMKQLSGIVPPPGRRAANADEAEKRLHTQKTKFVARVQKAERDWYARGHRKKPSQIDLALLVYGKGNKESAQSRFSREMKKMKKLGLTLADITAKK